MNEINHPQKNSSEIKHKQSQDKTKHIPKILIKHCYSNRLRKAIKQATKTYPTDIKQHANSQPINEYLITINHNIVRLTIKGCYVFTNEFSTDARKHKHRINTNISYTDTFIFRPLFFGVDNSFLFVVYIIIH